MWKNLAEEARTAIFNASKAAIAEGAPLVEPRHILIGILEIENARSYELLSQLGISAFHWSAELKRPVPDPPEGFDQTLSAEGRHVIDRAYDAARDFERLDDRHILIGIASGVDEAADFLMAKGATAEKLRQALR